LTGTGPFREPDKPPPPEQIPKKDLAAPAAQRFGWRRALGIVLFAVSVALFVAVPVTLFLPLSTGWKVGLVAVLLVAEEAVFWIAALLLGREVVRRYRRFFNPHYWLDKERR
jgi:predicted MFS family arabinose efflux permease